MPGRPWSPRPSEEHIAQAARHIAAALSELTAASCESDEAPPADGPGRWGALLSARDAAAYLGIGTTKLRELDIPCRFIDSRRLWKRCDLDAFVAELEAKGP